MSTFDLIIIGGGPAGYSAAIKATLQGYRVAVIEKSKIGGACINRGCIPTKALWGTAVSLQRLKDLHEHGIQTDGKFSFDYKVAMSRQFAIMEQMATTVVQRMSKLGVTILDGHGRVKKHDPKSKTQTFTVEIDKNGKTSEITGRFILVATGSRPIETPILKSDHNLILNTDDIENIKELPKTMAIVGGGVVACEFASILNKFGVKVHLLEHSSQILALMDQEVVAQLMHYFSEDGIKIFTQTKVSDIEKNEKSVNIHIERNSKKETLEVEKVLLAIGRRPNSDGMDLEKFGVKIAERGQIEVDKRLETACKGIFAAGDTVAGPMLAHKAYYDAAIAVGAMCGEEVHTNYETMPGAIFTVPEMASVGLQPDQARQKGIKIDIGKFEYKDNAQALCTGKTRGMVKIVSCRDTFKIIGCTMVGHDSSNLISEVALAIANGMTVNQLTATIHPHPTLSEMIWEAALDTQGRSVHKN